jgi:uncharacterized protein
MLVFPGVDGFEWDEANRDKIVSKHGISESQCEEVFFDEKKKLLRDRIHSGVEARYILIGKTAAHILLFTVFTIRGKKIRVISARPLNKKERSLYE